jgi:predicted alpha/beta-hydrolase family hydrolase
MGSSRPPRATTGRAYGPAGARTAVSRTLAPRPLRPPVRTVDLVATPRGDARVQLDLPTRPVGLLVLGHGAGGGITAPDLVAVAAAAAAAGWAVALVEQPYRVAGRRAPSPAPALDEAWVAVMAHLRATVVGRRRIPVVTGGRSSGARVACRTAGQVGAAGVLTLAFPTAPPGRPDKHRLHELAAPGVPVLVVQGDRDPFGVPPPAPNRTIHLIPGADHSLRKDRPGLVAAALGWLTDRLPTRPTYEV